MKFVDKVLTCVQCRAEFLFTAGEQEFFHDKGFENVPKHCKQCRARQKDKFYRPREETKIGCAECGEQTTVPFKPTQHRPVLCRICFKKSKEQVSQQPPLFRVK
jgi:CxxC-x17-CxxC domain-containing protein